jgi:hypothetical protein
MNGKPNRINVSLTDATYTKVSEKAAEHGVSMSALASIMITEWLEAKSMALSLEQILEMSKKEKASRAKKDISAAAE